MWNLFCRLLSQMICLWPALTLYPLQLSQSMDYILNGKYYQWKTHFVLLQHAPALSRHLSPNILFHLWRHPQLSTASSPLRPLLAHQANDFFHLLWVFVAVGRCDVAVTHAVPVCSLTPLPAPLRVPLYRLIWSQHLSRVWPWWLHVCRLFRCPQSKRYTKI